MESKITHDEEEGDECIGNRQAPSHETVDLKASVLVNLLNYSLTWLENTKYNVHAYATTAPYTN